MGYNLDLGNMNKAPSAKWYLKYHDQSVIGVWKTLLRDKYGITGFRGKKSAFCANILKDCKMVNVEINKVVGNGVTTYFWTDRWAG